MIFYDEPLYRPPSEAGSLIFQVTLGCSHNRCTFCEMYKSKSFRVRPFEEIAAEIDAAAEWGSVKRVFLADGDALAADTDFLLKVLERLNSRIPGIRRISSYAGPSNLLKKQPAELEALRSAGLSLIYYGIESGSDLILKKISKGALYANHKEAMLKADAAGMEISATLVTGLGGREWWREHIEQSARLVSEAPPAFLSTLSLMMSPAAFSRYIAAFDEFTPRDDSGMLEEEKLLIQLIDPPKNIIFRSNHASNALALRGTLPGDKNKICDKIETALNGELGIRPAWMRGL